MEFSGDASMNRSDRDRGEPGSEDAFARGAGAEEQPVPEGYMSADDDPAEEGAVQGGQVAAAAPAESERALEALRDKYLRLAAEFDNFRRRTTRERQEIGTRAQVDLLKLFLDAMDDLGRFAHIDPSTVDCATVVQGVDLVERKLLKALGDFGVQMVNPLDQPFDPALHEAVSTEPALSPEDDHMISRVFQPGFVHNGVLIRPARVVVKQWNG
jgi:molecular chaperone GrpE